MSGDDPYSGLCVHGTLPLVRDDGAPAGIRFARIGVDAPEDCLRDATGLPDAEMTLRVFGSSGEIRPYLAALEEHGGNAFSSLSASNAQGGAFAIVVRHDRPRADGDALDAAVRLLGAVPGFASAWARYRASEMAGMARRRSQDDHDALWKAEAGAVAAIPGAFTVRVGPAGVEFLSEPGLPTFVLTRDGSGPVLTWRTMNAGLPDDLAARYATALADAGVSRTVDGIHAMPLASLGPDAFGRAMSTVRILSQARERLADVEGTRTRLAEAFGDRAGQRTLARAVAGLPVLQFASGEPAAQASPRSGTAQGVAGSLLARLVRLNLLRPAWKPPEGTGPLRSRTRIPALYEATDAARSLVAGDLVEAAALAGQTRTSRPEPEARHGGTIWDALAAMAPDTVPSLLAEAAAAAVGHLPQEGEIPGHGKDYDAWMPAALCVLAGTATVDSEGRLGMGRGSGPRP